MIMQVEGDCVPKSRRIAMIVWTFSARSNPRSIMKLVGPKPADHDVNFMIDGFSGGCRVGSR